MSDMRPPTKAEAKKFVEYQKRRNMALAMFRPMAHQEPFFKEYAREHLVRGGNRCSSKGTIVWKCDYGSGCGARPSNYRPVRIEDVDVGDTIVGTVELGRQDIRCSVVTAKSEFSELGITVTTQRGYRLTGTSDHPVWACPPLPPRYHNSVDPDWKKAQWVMLSDLQVGWYVRMCKMEDSTSKGRLWWDCVNSVEGSGETDFVAISTNTETYISNGFVSHNSGKSTCAAVKFASVACDFPVTLDDGSVIDQRQGWQKGRPLTMWIIGYDLQHIGQTIYRLLFKPGLFLVIRDEVTGMYRTYREWHEQDRKRRSEARPSPPLIPARYVDQNSWVWENKKAKEFKKVIIRDPTTGVELAEIFCFSSKADPKAGDPVDFIWIDESIENSEHYSEWQARLIDRMGNIIWSSWPNTNNDALQKLTDRAITEAVKPNPLVREIVITLSDNKALSEKAREEALGMFSTEEERRARDKGEYITDLVRMYPLFNDVIHQAIHASGGDKLSKELERLGGMPPHTWTHEMILDPGTQSPGVLFGAIPPPDFGEYFVVYDEITTRADADELAELIRKKFGGREFNRFIIDAKAGAQHGMGYSLTVTDNYSRAFAKRGIKCRLTGTGFSLGCTNVGARIMAVQEWLHIGRAGFPKLRIVKANCPQLCEQLRKYKKASVNNDVRDDRPAVGQKIDLAVGLEYWAASYPCYVQSEAKSDPDDPMYEEMSWYRRFFGSHKQDAPKKVYRIGPKY